MGAKVASSEGGQHRGGPRYWRGPSPSRRESLVPGISVEARGRYHKACKTCHRGVLMARVKLRTPGSAWRALDPTPIDREGVRYFRIHSCADQGPPERPPGQSGLF